MKNHLFKVNRRLPSANRCGFGTKLKRQLTNSSISPKANVNLNGGEKALKKTSVSNTGKIKHQQTSDNSKSMNKKCNNPKNKSKDCTYDRCPEYFSVDGNDSGFSRYSLSCFHGESLNESTQEIKKREC